MLIHVYVRKHDVYNSCDDNYIININKNMMFRDCHSIPLYPINLLRAIGVNSILTTHYTVIDVDLFVSQAMREHFKSLPQSLLDDPKAILIYPTFSFNKQSVDDCVANGSCEVL